MSRTRKENLDRVGIGKFWAWQTQGLSSSANVIILGFVSIYCTNIMNMPPALVGMLLMGSKVVDAVTDLLAGYLVDKTNTKLGKGRPYEIAILGVWFFTWLLYSMPGEASLVLKSIWLFVTYAGINSICITLLSASNNVHMIRAFKTNGQRIRIASFGGIVIMIGAMAMNMLFPIAMSRLATSPKGWSNLIALFAIPLALIGILRFIFVKEDVEVETKEEKAEPLKLKDVGVLLKNNPYVYMVATMWMVYNLVNGMGIMSYFYTYVVGNVEIMGVVSAVGVFVLPIMIFFPMIMKKVPMVRMVQIGCILYAIGGLITFFAGGNVKVLIIATIFTGVGVLPITYLMDLMLLDCGSYNAWKGRQRMDGTIGAFKGFMGKVGSALGSGLVGILLSVSGYDGALTTQPDSAIMVIRELMGVIPALLFIGVVVILTFYKLDKMMPEINKFMEKQRES